MKNCYYEFFENNLNKNVCGRLCILQNRAPGTFFKEDAHNYFHAFFSKSSEHYLFKLPLVRVLLHHLSHFQKFDTAQKMKFSIKDFFNKCDQICRKLRLWLNLQRKSLKENFIFLCSARSAGTLTMVFSLQSIYKVSVLCLYTENTYKKQVINLAF